MPKVIGCFPTQKGEIAVLVENLHSTTMDYRRRVVVLETQDLASTMEFVIQNGTQILWNAGACLRIYANFSGYRLIGTLDGVHNGGGTRETFHFDAMGCQVDPVPDKDVYPLRDIPGVIEGGVLTSLIRNAL